MNEDRIQQILSNPNFKTLMQKKSSLSWTLSIIMLVIYVAFILIIGFYPSLFATPLAAGLTTTVGIPVGVLVILSAFVLTGIYVKKANSEFDTLTAEVVREVTK